MKVGKAHLQTLYKQRKTSPTLGFSCFSFQKRAGKAHLFCCLNRQKIGFYFLTTPDEAPTERRRRLDAILATPLYPDKTIAYTGIQTNTLRMEKMKNETASARRKELAAFLQAIRNRSQPADFGFPQGTRRRAVGLRREETAQLVGISTTWYTWIEQGREVNISADALDRLAANLRLTRSERAYLFELAGRRDPHGYPSESDDAPPLLIELLADVGIPAYLMGRYWDMLGWNAAASELFTGWLDVPRDGGEAPPNLLSFVFLEAWTRTFLVDWETRARRITAEFRADCRNSLDDPALMRMVDRLTAASADFARFWKQHDVLERQGGERRFLHPLRGEIRYQQATLRPDEHERLKLVMLRPA
jgi:transcriptional regulator with XRE-family HTH domain